MVYAIKQLSKNGESKEKGGKEKNPESLKVAQRLYKYALSFVTEKTPVQAYKAFLSCHISLTVKSRQITPKDDNVLLNTLYYAFHGKADNTSAKGFKESDLKDLIGDFYVDFADALALADGYTVVKDEDDNDESEQDGEQNDDDDEPQEDMEEDSFYPSSFNEKQTAYLDAMIGGNRRKGLAIGMSLSKEQLKECKDFIAELEKELG